MQRIPLPFLIAVLVGLGIVIIVRMTEIGAITPVGTNVYVISGVVPDVPLLPSVTPL
jgi:hypothetical protein